ncbi:hypothetical protein [Piscinibacter sp.]|uniref:hypothetical protein n=1 Tax=Piscinibacter sp. TaxID=1903157 RepID=UPI001B645C8B|nr:hypothetical protein [Piscinibacter sp.]MBP6543235.1 hypothetical protein [Piscinibacter sp.]HPG79149.1 hypothetical protein [Piscinibacter sp.]
MTPHRFALALLLAPLGALAQDAVTTDGDKYTLVLENAQVRVLSYRDLPGQRTHEHRHPAFVAVALAPFQRVLHLPDGRLVRREFRAGEVMWSDAQTHIGENVGNTPTEVVLVELKPAPPTAACGSR